MTTTDDRPTTEASPRRYTEQEVPVGPGLAAKWLGRNMPNNRALKWSKIPGMIRDMQNGKWRSDTSEPIRFDPEGFLIDGQNRLTAVVESGCTVLFDVAYNVPRAAVRVIDSGSARTFSDNMKMFNARDRMAGSGTLRWVWAWDLDPFPSRTGYLGRRAPTHSDLEALYFTDPPGWDEAAMRGRDASVQNLGAPSAFGLTHVLFSRIDEEDCKQFFDQLISGINLPEASPIATLRARLLGREAKHFKRQDQAALTIRGWNAWRRDETPRTLIVTKSEKLTNDNFPLPI